MLLVAIPYNLQRVLLCFVVVICSNRTSYTTGLAMPNHMFWQFSRTMESSRFCRSIDGMIWGSAKLLGTLQRH